MFMTPWRNLAPWLLLLVQESYLFYINSKCKHLGYKIYTAILKNHMQATLDAIIGENQLAAIKINNITHISNHSTCNWCFSIFCYFGPFFALLTPSLTPYNPQNQNFEKKRKTFGDVIILNLWNKKTRSYDVCLLRYGVLAQT